MKHKIGNICIILGTALMLGALSLFLYNRQEAEAARQASNEHLAQLVEVLYESYPDTPEEAETDWLMDQVLPYIPREFLTAEELKMTETVINGYAYIGYLSIPSLELELPILSDWNYPKMNIAPCRYYGTLRGENLVLMAHNFPHHFGNIHKLQEGDSVIFVDMDGYATKYQVVGQDVLPPTAVEEMTAGLYDLTLFTCTVGGNKRVAVYCDRISKPGTQMPG